MHEISPKKLFKVCVEGNIGCGKTTFLNFFSKKKNVQVFYEPIHKWRNLKKHNLLDLMYKDPLRWSHMFQTYVQLTMLEQHIKPCYKPTKLIERSVFSARHCFVENLHKTGKMSDAEYEVYCGWYDMITKTLGITIDLIVYLRTDPEVLHERILTRSRKEETQISLEYLQTLHDLHEEWLLGKPRNLLAPVLVMDADQPLSQMYQIYEKHAHQIVYEHSPSPVVNISEFLDSSLESGNVQ